MLIGAYNACLGDKPLGEALDMIASLGLTSAEINSGGCLPPALCLEGSCKLPDPASCK